MVEESSSLSPFHAGEIALQQRVGVRDRVEALGTRMIRDHLTDQHQAFFAELPTLLVGSRDTAGRLWASLLSAEAGFMSSPDPKTLNVASAPIAGDPLGENLAVGSRLGLLGIQFETRRRNRVSAHVKEGGVQGFSLAIDQTFGNCPQYIQSRTPHRVSAAPGAAQINAALNNEDAALIQQADTFFIASGIQGDESDPSAGQDVSHRGGKPGFVKVEGNVITWPDFPGNGHFNTLGNLSVDPRAGLLFMDFASGDSLQLTGQAEVLWDAPQQSSFEGAERFVQFTTEQAIRIPGALPFRWHFNAASPVNKRTGTWADL